MYARADAMREAARYGEAARARGAREPPRRARGRRRRARDRGHVGRHRARLRVGQRPGSEASAYPFRGTKRRSEGGARSLRRRPRAAPPGGARRTYDGLIHPADWAPTLTALAAGAHAEGAGARAAAAAAAAAARHSATFDGGLDGPALAAGARRRGARSSSTPNVRLRRSPPRASSSCATATAAIRPALRRMEQPELDVATAPRAPAGAFELYDLEADPAETRDAAAEHPRVVAAAFALRAHEDGGRPRDLRHARLPACVARAARRAPRPGSSTVQGGGTARRCSHAMLRVVNDCCAWHQAANPPP